MSEVSDRRIKLERLLDEADARGESVTNVALGEILGVAQKTIQRDLAEMGRGGKNKSRPPLSTRAVDVIEDANLNTLFVIDRAIRRTDDQLNQLNQEMGFTSEKCECCGRKRLVVSAQGMMANFKGGDTLNAQLTTRAKLLGELIENYVVTVQQRDADVALIFETIVGVRSVGMRDLVEHSSLLLPDGEIDVSAVSEALMRKLLAAFKEKSARRAMRLPTARQVIDSVAVEVMPAPGEET